MVGTAVERRFPGATVILRQGDPADRLFLLTKGTARHFFITPEGRKVYLQWLSPGDIFGGASVLRNPTPLLVNTEVTQGSHALVWQRNTIRNLAARYPNILENVLSIATDYLVWFLASHLSLICHSARGRLAHVVVSLTNGIGRRCPNGVRLQVTNEQLANTANITLFTVSRLMSEWHRKGILVKHRGGILLRHPEKLFNESGTRIAKVSDRQQKH